MYRPVSTTLASHEITTQIIQLTVCEYILLKELIALEVVCIMAVPILNGEILMLLGVSQNHKRERAATHTTEVRLRNMAIPMLDLWHEVNRLVPFRILGLLAMCVNRCR